MLSRSALVAALVRGARMASGLAPRQQAYVSLFQKEIQAIKDAGTFKNERVITTPQSSSIRVTSSDKEKLNFCANNYLGLANNPILAKKAMETVEKYGYGLSSVRFICGTQEIHKEFEHKLAEFHHKEDAILYGSCFDANGGVFEALLGPDDAIVSDRLNHASIIDGMRLRKKGCEMLPYEHMDMADLEKKLQAVQGKRLKLIATDGVFSMDGDIAPLREICDLADKYNAMVFVDESHATGFFGATGRGVPEYLGVESRVDIINSTLGKALGGATGGYTTSCKEIIALLRNRSRPYLFSNSLPPATVGAGLAVLDMLTKDTSHIERLRANTKMFRTLMTQAGFKIKGDPMCPIAPVMLYDEKVGAAFAEKMLARDIFVVSFSFPVVPKGQARIRVQLSAAHTPEQVQRCVDAFIEIGKELKVIH